MIHALDNHPELYKDHCRRWALPVGRGMYHKILDVPHYYQTGDLDGDGRLDEDDFRDEDGDGRINEDAIDGIDNDQDGLVDEDGLTDDDGDGIADEDPPKVVWCGEATAKMWIDYKHGFSISDYTRSPTELEIARWVLTTFGNYADDLDQDGVIEPEERTVRPLEYGSILNHFMPSTKYHRYVSASADDIIGREAHLIAEYREPSAAVCEMERPGDANDPDDEAWHWLLVVGCAASGWPGSGGVNVYGLWVHDPGGWFSPIPAYVSSDIWKQKYFERYTDWDGASGYMHVEDPPSGDERIDHLLPVRCEPPTKPHGTPVSLQHVQQIAAEGVSLHLLNVVGHLAPYFHKAQPATPEKVRSLSPKFGDYYIVPFMQAGKVTALVIVDAVNGQFHGASACSISTDRFPLISETQVRQQVTSRTGKGIQRVELVWEFCEEAKSPYTPLWRVTYSDGDVLFISQKGTVHRQITKHSCIKNGRPN